MGERSVAGSVDEYIAGLPPLTREQLENLRGLIREAAPGATEKISYAIPTFDLNGHHLIHIAGYKNHVGMYPVIGDLDATFRQELKPYKHGRGTARFPLDRPLPVDLIRGMVEFLVRASNSKAGR